MEVGFYGKLPSHGDFLRRRVADSFLHVWDEWLQQSIAASRNDLGDRWLEIYLTSPVWRFACDAGLFGEHGFAGVVAPSVDRVGRYFPLTVCWQIPAGTHPFAVAQHAETWFDRIERLILETLAAEAIDLEAFDGELEQSTRWLETQPWSAGDLDLNAAAQLSHDVRNQWRVPTSGPASLAAMAQQLLYARLRETHAPLTLLWTDGSVAIEPCCLIVPGLPAPTSFAALLSGSWTHSGWRCIDGQVAAVPQHTDTWIGGTQLRFASAALSDIGRSRAVNQDALIERPDVGMWAVADGMGGHDHGEVASRMVCDALAELIPAETLFGTAERVVDRLRRVNSYLYRASLREHNPMQSGSTVVVLVVRGDRCALLWVGDSRIYRLRRGELALLTRDHSAEDPAGSNAISRAIGGESDVDVEIAYDHVEPGDRFVLCSDGLNHEIDDATIRQHLEHDTTQACTQALIDAALAAGGRDNVSVVVVDAAMQSA